jgi:ATP phosphoribosyltransferase regulatory subunit
VPEVFSPLPIGARDLLPATTRRRRAVTDRLLGVFERWGYREIAPPLIEYFEVLGRGLGSDERERCVRFIEAGTGDLVALRSDVTPQIARMVAQRVGGTVEQGDELRLCYAATLVRLPRGRHEHAELHQVGVEYVGEPDPSADAELIGLCDEALVQLGLVDHRIDLAHTAIVRDALAFLDLSPAREAELRERLARKDREGLLAVLERCAVARGAREAFASLCTLHGPPALLDEARTRLAVVGAGEAVDRLRTIVETVEREHPRTHARLILDLGEVRGFDYYTGMRVRVWAPGSAAPIARGGRYDHMLARYGADLPATGLAIDLDALDEALIAAELELAEERPIPGLLVALAERPASADARALAVAEVARARAEGLRAWIETGLALDRAQALAERRGATRLTWFQADRGERWRRVDRVWQPEADLADPDRNG